MTDYIRPTEAEIKNKLSPEEFEVTQRAGTEAPFSGQYWNEQADGSYACKVCGQVLFTSENKFESGSGWPSFDRAVPGAVTLRLDSSHGMERTEVVCSQCEAHLGHKFDDGPKETSGERFCINSASLNLMQNKS